MSNRSLHPFLVLLLLLWGCADGSVSSDDDLLPPALVEPVPGATTADAVLLVWSEAEAAQRYHLQVAMDETFTDLVADETTNPFPRFPVRSLTKGELYYWRVRAESGEMASAWSEPRAFSVNRTANIPDVPRLTLPAYDQRNMDRLVHLEWEPVEGAYSYHLVVTLDEDMLLYQADLENVDTPYFELEQLVFTYPYWWKVRALGPAGYSEWSSVSLFWVKPAQ